MTFDPMNPPQLSREDRQVAGCDCGGLHLHVVGCSLFAMDPADARQAIETAEATVRGHGEWLNAQLATMLPVAVDRGRWGPSSDRITVTYRRRDDDGGEQR